MEVQKRLTTAQAAAILSRPEQTLRNWRSKRYKGRPGPPYYQEMGTIYYLEEDLVAWVAANRVDPSKRPAPAPASQPAPPEPAGPRPLRRAPVNPSSLPS